MDLYFLLCRIISEQTFLVFKSFTRSLEVFLNTLWIIRLKITFSNIFFSFSILSIWLRTWKIIGLQKKWRSCFLRTLIQKRHWWLSGNISWPYIIMRKITLLREHSLILQQCIQQIVQLTLNVCGTETFVCLVTRMINMLNVKSTVNDSDREKFESVDDDRYEFLENMATMFEKMDTATSKYPTRVMSLTSQTSNALSLSIRGIIEIIKMLLGKGIKYVLTGNSKRSFGRGIRCL